MSYIMTTFGERGEALKRQNDLTESQALVRQKHRIFPLRSQTGLAQCALTQLILFEIASLLV